MERRSSRYDLEHSDIKNLENPAEKEPAGAEDGNELRVDLESLRQLHDQTHRKLKVRVGPMGSFEVRAYSFVESTYSTYWNWRFVVTCLIYELIPQA